MSNRFEKKIENAISRHALLRRDGFYIVALSGGPDSVALLRALVAMGYQVHAAHCNFHLRGEESNRDEHFCEALCGRVGVTMHKIHFDTTGYAELHQVSIEMAARSLRYHYFAQLCHDIGADGICVGHHRDDQVETILLNLIRGTGIGGLQGMKWRNANVLRPMLGVSREEVLHYLADLQQPYVVDRTNLVDDVQRNKIRLNVIPMLETINPAVKEHVLRMAEHVAEADVIVCHALGEQARRVCLATQEEQVKLRIDLASLNRQPSPEYLLWHLLSPYGFSRIQVVEILNNQIANNKWICDKWVAFVEHRHLCVTSMVEWESSMPPLRLPECGTFVVRQRQRQMRVSIQVHEGYQPPSRSPLVATLDADCVSFPLTLRQAQAGDRFVPYGMKGSKLVSDFLKDQKIGTLNRRQQLVLADSTGAIIWLVGRRTDERVAIRPGSTRRVLTVKWT